MYNLICMSFDGDYVTEKEGFKTIDEAWKHAEDMGSRWYFYPFCFVTTGSGKSIAAAPDGLEELQGRRVATVKKVFKQFSEQPEMQGADCDKFAVCLSIALDLQ